MPPRPAPKPRAPAPKGLGAGYSVWLKDGAELHTTYALADVKADGSLVLNDRGKCPGLAYGPGEWAALEWRGS